MVILMMMKLLQILGSYWLSDSFQDLKLMLFLFYHRKRWNFLTNTPSWWLMLLEIYQLMCLVEFVEGKLTWRTLLIYQAPLGPRSMIDKFVMDIRSYTSYVSGCTSPAAVIMIGVNCSVSLCIRYLFKLVFFFYFIDCNFDVWCCDFCRMQMLTRNLSLKS